jgi:hypothetical protein
VGFPYFQIVQEISHLETQSRWDRWKQEEGVELRTKDRAIEETHAALRKKQRKEEKKTMRIECFCSQSGRKSVNSLTSKPSS